MSYLTGPVTIVTCPPVDEVLFPNDISCQILKDVRKAAMADFDDIPGLKEDRIEVERALGKQTSNRSVPCLKNH